jgi:large subunit ribosomal protein L6
MSKKDTSIFISKRLSLFLSNTSLLISSGIKKFSYPLVNSFFFDSQNKRLALKEKESSNIKIKKFSGLESSKLREGVLGSQISYFSEIEIVGIGYGVVKETNQLIFKLGYSHFKKVEIPNNLSVTVEKGRIIKVEGVNKAFINNFAIELQKLRNPSAYKKKGMYLVFKKSPKLKQGKRS